MASRGVCRRASAAIKALGAVATQRRAYGLTWSLPRLRAVGPRLAVGIT